MTSATESINLANIVFYAILTLPSIYCLVKHGKYGIFAWGYVIAMCGLRLAGNGMSYHDLTTTGEANKTAGIITGIGLSPLLLATVGMLHEANISVRKETLPFLGVPGMVVSHLIISGGIALSAASGSKPSLLKAGMIVLTTGWCIVLVLVMLSWRVRGPKSRYSGETKLLLALSIAAPLVSVRVVYAVVNAFKYGFYSRASIPIQVVFGTLPEFLAMLIYLSAGVLTQNLALDREG